MISVRLQNEKTVEMAMKGDVTAEDYQAIIPELKSLINQKGKLKFLIVLDKLKSFSLGAAYEDIKFDLQNLRNVGTTAIVGDRKSQEMLAHFINKIFPEDVKYFEVKNKKGALNWLKKY